MEILSFPMTPFITNCFVIRDEAEALVVDPGDVTPELIDAIAGYRVDTIVNTHCHLDHCAGNARLIRRTGAKLLLHPDELPLLHAIPQQAMMFGVPADSSPEPDGFLQPGDRVTVGNTSFSVRLTPGHSPGHIVLVGDGVVIGGDVLFSGSIGRTDLPGGDYEQLLHSIQTQLLTLPDTTVVHCGHGPSTTIGIERRTNPFLAGLS
ncbi:MAG: MBL fold hydrolase [Candidatus Hydrogenedentota bacterium]